MKLRFDVNIQDLATKGYSLLPQALTANEASQLLRLAKIYQHEGKFQKAQVGVLQSRQRREEIRGDSTFWIDDSSNEHDLIDFRSRLQNTLSYLREALRIPLSQIEMHFAHYPPHTGYGEHVDQPYGSKGRLISFVLYLNSHWKSEWGGQLQLWPLNAASQAPLQVEPEAGQMIFFLSESIVHEVILCSQDRWSITGWMRR